MSLKYFMGGTNLGMVSHVIFMKFIEVFLLPKPKEEVTGKTIIITGANNGVGLEAARLFAKLKAKRIVLACRNMASGKRARDSILATKGVNDVEVLVWKLDLSSFPSIISFAEKIYEELDRVDIFINNAGVIFGDENLVTFDGYGEVQRGRELSEYPTSTKTVYETTMLTNFISPAIICLLVLPKLQESAKNFGTTPVLTITSSEAHWGAKFPEKTEALSGEMTLLQALSDPELFYLGDLADIDRYSTSKLLNLFFIRELASQIDDVTATAPTPGLTRTDIGGTTGYSGGILTRFASTIFGRDPEKAARNYYVATVKAGEKAHGEFIRDGAIHKADKYVYTEEAGVIQKMAFKEVSQLAKEVSERSPTINAKLIKLLEDLEKEDN